MKAPTESGVFQSFEVASALTEGFVRGCSALDRYGKSGGQFYSLGKVLVTLDCEARRPALSSDQRLEFTHFLKENREKKRQVSIIWLVAFVLIWRTFGG